MARVLAGRFELEQLIAEGGMAAVWRARDSRLDRLVAVKIMADRIAKDPEFRARFSQEARAAASFSHPNVVDVLDYGEEDDLPYIVMEFVDGEDLRARIEREGRLRPSEVARIGAGVARGLAAAHRRGLIHRDVKPANILLDGEGTPKVTDFGIVRAVGAATVTRPGTTYGSVHYLSPEQVQGAPVDGRSDIYSLGVVLYEAATGERPFDGDAPAAIAVRRLSEAPRPPHAVEPTLPQWLSAIIERAMARDPEQRYRTAAELERDLVAHHAPVVTGDPMEDTVGLPVPVPPRAMRPARPGARPVRPVPAPITVRRRSLVPFLTAVLVALAFIGLGLFFLLFGTQNVISVPNVVGMQRDAAIAELSRAGLRADPRGPDPNPRPFGEVYRQEPGPPTPVEPGTTVVIFWSGGPGSVQIPILRGVTVEEARTRLEAVGLQRGNVERQPDDNIAEGRVIFTNPQEGLTVPAGTTVNLITSSGPRPTPSPPPTSPAPTLTLPPIITPTPGR